MYGTVYIIHNLVNGKYYVGQTIQRLHRRFTVHANQPHTYIAKAIRKYGRDKFLIEPICQANNAEELDRLEALWIVALKAHVKGVGYNCMTTVGHLTAESLARLAATKTGVRRSAETNAKVSAGLKRYFSAHGSPKKGVPMKDSQRDKLKARVGPLNSRWGKHDTEETKERRRLKLLGQKRSLGTRQRNATASRITKNGRGLRSEETKLHMRWLRLTGRLSGPRLYLQHGTGNYF